MARKKLYPSTEDILANKENVAEILRDKLLDEMGMAVVNDFIRDKESRVEWEEKTENNMKLALQVAEEKSVPWPNAANVKHPMLTLSAIQFAARVDLFQGQDIARCSVNGYDPDGLKTDRAVRVGKHMSYQLRVQMEDWEDDNDRMMHALPIIGSMFKKSYYCPIDKRNKSELVYPRDLVFDYYAKNVEKAQRKTHVMWMYENDIIERQRTGLFRTVDIDFDIPDEPLTDYRTATADDFEGLDADNEDGPREILEQHCFWDLDNDGYQEPYIVTVDAGSRKVLRVVPRYKGEAVIRGDSGISKISATEYFTQFSFIPDPNGGNLGIGFGHLQGPIVEVVNTIINQLIDAGTLSNMQSGFIGKGLRTKGGNLEFEPGQWLQVQATGEDLKNNIVPLPVRDPSNVLFMLLGMIVEGGEKVGSITDAIVGDNPPANQPATTTLATIEQGMKVFKKIHKRLYSAFSKEFKKLYRLNREHLEDKEFFEVMDLPQSEMMKLIAESQVLANQQSMLVIKNDYKHDGLAITPTADPNVMTEAERLKKIEVLFQTMDLGWNPEVVRKRFVEAMEFPNPDELMQPPPPPPEDPKLTIEKMRLEVEMKKLEFEAQKFQVQMEVETGKTSAEVRKIEAEIEQLVHEAVKTNAEAKQLMAEMEQDDSDERSTEKQIELAKLRSERELKEIELAIKREELAIKRDEIGIKDKQESAKLQATQDGQKTEAAVKSIPELKQMLAELKQEASQKESVKVTRNEQGDLESLDIVKESDND